MTGTSQWGNNDGRADEGEKARVVRSGSSVGLVREWCKGNVGSSNGSGKKKAREVLALEQLRGELGVDDGVPTRKDGGMSRRECTCCVAITCGGVLCRWKAELWLDLRWPIPYHS